MPEAGCERRRNEVLDLVTTEAGEARLHHDGDVDGPAVGRCAVGPDHLGLGLAALAPRDAVQLVPEDQPVADDLAEHVVEGAVADGVRDFVVLWRCDDESRRDGSVGERNLKLAVHD